MVTKPLREVAFSISYPIIDRIGRSSEKLPIAGVVSRNDELRHATVTQRKPRCVRINSRAAPIAHGQTHPSFSRHVDPVKPRLLRSHRGSRRVDFEIFLITIELEQSHHRRAFEHTQRDALVAQCDDSQSRARRQSHKVTRVKLDFHPALLVGGDRVAFDKRVIHPRAFPILVAISFEVHFPGD